MATLPSAFYGEHASGADLSFLLAAIPGGKGKNYLFDRVVDADSDPKDELIVGGKKDEIFYVNSGDTVVGGKGYDVVVQSPNGDQMAPLRLNSSVESGVLTGSRAGDIIGNGQANTLVGNDGANELLGNSGGDVLIGDGGDDTLVGGKGNDTLSGGEGHDDLFGGKGNDRLEGLAGDDALFGSSGRDTLIGGPGNDTLFGGSGKDQLVGDDGSDVFGFLRGESGVDVVADFEAGIDRIDLSDFGTDFNSLSFKNDGEDVVVTVGSGKNAVKFKLLGYQASDLDQSFFQF